MREFKDSVTGKDDDDESRRDERAPRPTGSSEAPRTDDHRAVGRRASASPSRASRVPMARLPRRLEHGERPRSSSTSTSCARASRVPGRARRSAFVRRLPVPRADPRVADASRCPRRRPARHARRHRAVLHLVQGRASYAGLRARAAGHPLADLELPRAGVRAARAAGRRRSSSRSRPRCFAGGLAFGYFVVLPARARFLTELRRRALRHQQIRASYYFSFVTLALLALGAHLRAADLHPRARAPRGADLRHAAPEPAHRYSSSRVVAVAPAHGRPDLARLRDDPAPRPLRALDLARRRCSSAAGRRAGVL